MIWRQFWTSHLSLIPCGNQPSRIRRSLQNGIKTIFNHFRNRHSALMLWGATRSLISSSIVLGVVATFGLIASPLALLIPLLAFLCGLMFSALAMCFTPLAPNIDFFNYPGFLFITPMFLLSGTFFPLTQLPTPMQTFAKAVLPLTPTVDLSRALLLGNLQTSLVISIVWVTVVTPVFFVLSSNIMKKRLVK